MACVHNKVHGVISQKHREEDISIERKCVEQLRTVAPEALGIQKQFVCPLPKAVSLLLLEQTRLIGNSTYTRCARSRHIKSTPTLYAHFQRSSYVLTFDAAR